MISIMKAMDLLRGGPRRADVYVAWVLAYYTGYALGFCDTHQKFHAVKVQFRAGRSNDGEL